MTISLKIRVNGMYVATVTNKTLGVSFNVGPNEERDLNYGHGQLNEFTIEEEFVENEDGAARARERTQEANAGK